MPTTKGRRTKLNKRAFFEDVGYKPHPGRREIHMATADIPSFGPERPC